MDSATDVIRREASALQKALSPLAPDALVPTCPGWGAADLLWHVAEVHGFWAEILRTGATSDAEIESIEAAKEARPDSMDELRTRRENATTSLVDQLESRDDAEPAWSWLSSDQTVGFTRRMQVHEASIHRVDAELTAQRQVTPPSSEVASDGIAHAVDVMWTADHAWTSTQAVVSPIALLILREEGGGETPVEISRADPLGSVPGDLDRVLARRAPDRDLSPGSALLSLPHVQASGSAVALYLWAWGRGAALPLLRDGERDVDIQGEAEAVAALERLLDQGMQ